MRFPRFYLISDRRRMGKDPVASLRRLGDRGLPAFQWREKDLPPIENHRLLSKIADGVSSHPTRILVNDRVDLASALRIGVHLPENGLPTHIARRLLAPDAWIGRSTHSAVAARNARDEGADFVTFGPIYDTPSKRGYGPPVGLAALREVAQELPGFPIVAIGGITEERVEECLDAGASGIAVIGAVWDAPDPVEAWLSFARSLGIPTPPAGT